MKLLRDAVLAERAIEIAVGHIVSERTAEAEVPEMEDDVVVRLFGEVNRSPVGVGRRIAVVREDEGEQEFADRQFLADFQPVDVVEIEAEYERIVDQLAIADGEKPGFPFEFARLADGDVAECGDRVFVLVAFRRERGLGPVVPVDGQSVARGVFRAGYGHQGEADEGGDDKDAFHK